mmetsp:Transcript_6724/g.21300  ORF Transcript_6724/g.21300 Transcript_6724/m.21300 type:complete len:240 (+) Transcript_6724:52-771(+)
MSSPRSSPLCYCPSPSAAPAAPPEATASANSLEVESLPMIFSTLLSLARRIATKPRDSGCVTRRSGLRNSLWLTSSRWAGIPARILNSFPSCSTTSHKTASGLQKRAPRLRFPRGRLSPWAMAPSRNVMLRTACPSQEAPAASALLASAPAPAPAPTPAPAPASLGSTSESSSVSGLACPVRLEIVQGTCADGAAPLAASSAVPRVTMGWLCAMPTRQRRLECKNANWWWPSLPATLGT